MRFASLGSGSAGNCMVIQQADTCVMLDCGFSLREIVTRLERLALQPEQITGILITHEHDDHAKGAFKYAAKYDIPIWLSHGTRQMCDRYLPDAPVATHIIDSHTSFSIQDICVTPYPVPHDAREPTQFIFSNGRCKLGVLTDTGSSTPYIEAVLSGCDALVLECNHDLNMLENGPYSAALKKRVSGRLGHLDNEAAATLLSRLDNNKLKHIFAAHLSAKNNTRTLAKVALSRALNCSPDWVGVAEQNEGFSWRDL